MGMGLFDFSTQSTTQVYNTTQTWQDSNNRVANAPITLSESGNTTIALPSATGSAAVAEASTASNVLPMLGLVLLGVGAFLWLNKG